MTALAKDTVRPFRVFREVDLTLASGSIAYKNGRAALNPTTGKVVPASSSPTLLMLGRFMRKVDASAADKAVPVDLEREVRAEWYANHSGGDAVAATDIGRLCYVLDDNTVTITPTNRPIAGRVWEVDATKGVLVEKLDTPRALCLLPTAAAFAAGDLALAASAVVHDAVYDVPATAANSTITLPAAVPDGTRITFVADGTKNGHTVTYRDATGPVALTAALTASKRHLVICHKVGGLWFANAAVSP